MRPSITPVRAPVRPRTISPDSGETVPLEDVVCALLEPFRPGVVQIVGGPGSGKSVALHHLAAVLPESEQIWFLDDADDSWRGALSSDRLLIIVARKPESIPQCPSLRLRLVPWGEDELIEYLLAVHRERCAAVMSRVRSDPDRTHLSGIPELWRIVLNRVAEDPSATIADALRHELHRTLTHVKWPAGLQRACFESLTGSQEHAGQLLVQVAARGANVEIFRLVRHRYMQLLLESQRLAALLDLSGSVEWLSRKLPPDLVELTARGLTPQALRSLQALLAGKSAGYFAMAASLLFAADPFWRPVPGGSTRSFSGAYFPQARWADLDLREVHLNAADLTSADLSRARIAKSQLIGAELAGANLQHADLDECDFQRANLAGADLSFCHAKKARFDDASLVRARLEGAKLFEAIFDRADLEDASFVRAYLSGSKIWRVNLAGADFRDANCDAIDCPGTALYEADFRGATFRAATLTRCDLEGMVLPGADFTKANLEGALLTDSQMPHASFRRANLRNTGLAEINWEGAYLCHADLRGCTFHLGSTRSGLVGSPIACEGSRTGFYTDDYNEQEFKSPEEIRKANLRGADLRGTRIDGVDFYLVDLRDALYTPEQAEQFRRSGAILHGPRELS